MKYIILTLIILVILIILYLIINYLKKPSINYISDPFFDRMSIYDLIAYNVKSKEEFKNKYIESITQFNNNELDKLNKNKDVANKMIRQYIKENNNNFSRLLLKLSDINIEILKQPFIKYPHTLGKTIFTPFVIEPKTIIHEKIHILQRLYPDDIDNIYKIDGYIKSDLKYKLQRNNPDNNNYIYTINNNPIVCLYNSENPKDINDITKLIDDHPNEIYAYKYADIIFNI
jgi:hypothetical protein